MKEEEKIPPFVLRVQKLLAVRSTVSDLLFLFLQEKITIHAFIVQFSPNHGPDHEAFHIAFDQLHGLRL